MFDFFSTFLSSKSQVHWVGTVLWTGNLNLFPGTRQQQTPQLTTNPTSIKGIQHSTVNWVAWLCFLVSSVDQMYSQLTIFSIYGSRFIGNGIYSEMEKQAQNQCLDSTLPHPRWVSQGWLWKSRCLPRKSSSRDSAGLAPWCSSLCPPNLLPFRFVLLF